jgi:hypothetical protein
VFSYALGGFSAPEGYEESKPPIVARWINFLLLQFLSSIVALNTLVAILGDSFGKVMEGFIVYDTLKKI